METVVYGNMSTIPKRVETRKVYRIGECGDVTMASRWETDKYQSRYNTVT